MIQKKLDRINELAHAAKERELTEDEKAERDALRKEYIEDFRRATIETLENTYVVSEDGKSRMSVKEYNDSVKKAVNPFMKGVKQ